MNRHMLRAILILMTAFSCGGCTIVIPSEPLFAEVPIEERQFEPAVLGVWMNSAGAEMTIKPAMHGAYSLTIIGPEIQDEESLSDALTADMCESVTAALVPFDDWLAIVPVTEDGKDVDREHPLTDCSLLLRCRDEHLQVAFFNFFALLLLEVDDLPPHEVHESDVRITDGDDNVTPIVTTIVLTSTGQQLRDQLLQYRSEDLFFPLMTLTRANY